MIKRVFLSLVLVFIASRLVPHPLKLSTMKLFQEKNRIQFECRIFQEDLDAAIQELLKKPYPFYQHLGQEEKEVLSRYFRKKVTMP